MLDLKQKAEMKLVVEQLYIYFPSQTDWWQELKPHLTPKVVNFYENYWQGVANNLYAFCSNLPEPNLSYLDAFWQELIRVASHYYKVTFLMLCQSEQFLRSEAKSRGIDFLSDKLYFLFMLMDEDNHKDLEMWQHAVENGSYESLSGQDWLDGFRTGTQFLKGEINNKILQKRGQRLIEKEEKFKNSLSYYTHNKAFSICNRLCLEVWFKNREKILAYDSWVEAQDNFRTMFTSKDSPAYGMGKKITAIYNSEEQLEMYSYPGRGKGKQKGFS